MSHSHLIFILGKKKIEEYNNGYIRRDRSTIVIHMIACDNRDTII